MLGLAVRVSWLGLVPGVQGAGERPPRVNEKRALRKRGFWALVVVVENDVFGDDLVMVAFARTTAQRCQASRSWLQVCMADTVFLSKAYSRFIRLVDFFSYSRR